MRIKNVKKLNTEAIDLALDGITKENQIFVVRQITNANSDFNKILIFGEERKTVELQNNNKGILLVKLGKTKSNAKSIKIRIRS